MGIGNACRATCEIQHASNVSGRSILRKERRLGFTRGGPRNLAPDLPRRHVRHTEASQIAFSSQLLLYAPRVAVRALKFSTILIIDWARVITGCLRAVSRAAVPLVSPSVNLRADRSASRCIVERTCRSVGITIRAEFSFARTPSFPERSRCGGQFVSANCAL